MTKESFRSFAPRPYLKGIAVVALVFGVATVLSGGGVLFGTDTVREMAGRFVPFVVWFNFIAGFAYITAGVGIWRIHRWALGLSIAIAVATFAVAVGFGIWVVWGGAYEMRTAGALALRCGLWVAISLTLRHVGARP